MYGQHGERKPAGCSTWGYGDTIAPSGVQGQNPRSGVRGQERSPWNWWGFVSETL